MSDMMSFMYNMFAPMNDDAQYTAYRIVCLILLIAMIVCALAAIILVLIQPGNSTGIDALGGSSETFFGKNKGRSLESKMKRWTVICLVVLAVFAVAFFILQLDGVWGL